MLTLPYEIRILGRLNQVFPAAGYSLIYAERSQDGLAQDSILGPFLFAKESEALARFYRYMVSRFDPASGIISGFAKANEAQLLFWGLSEHNEAEHESILSTHEKSH